MASDRFSFTQPCCVICWSLRTPGRPPVVLRPFEREVCCYCGEPATDGIYVRVDPATVAHPTQLKKEQPW